MPQKSPGFVLESTSSNCNIKVFYLKILGSDYNMAKQEKLKIVLNFELDKQYVFHLFFWQACFFVGGRICKPLVKLQLGCDMPALSALLLPQKCPQCRPISQPMRREILIWRWLHRVVYVGWFPNVKIGWIAKVKFLGLLSRNSDDDFPTVYLFTGFKQAPKCILQLLLPETKISLKIGDPKLPSIFSNVVSWQFHMELVLLVFMFFSLKYPSLNLR